MKIGLTCSRDLAKFPKYLSECFRQSIKKINAVQYPATYLSFITGDAKSDIECGKILEDWGYDVHYLAPANKLVNIIFSKNLYTARNKNVVNNCGWLISIWDGISPGTANTTKYAENVEKKLLNLLIIQKTQKSRNILLQKKKGEFENGY